jgi:hypothetical protein
MPPDLAAHFLPDRDYERARSLDLSKMSTAADSLKKAWTEEIRGTGR